MIYSNMRLTLIYFSLALAFAALDGSCHHSKSPTTGVGGVSNVNARVSTGVKANSTPSATNNSARDAMKTLTSGIWGGRGIQLSVTENAATIEYDCAHGTIDQKIALDTDGRFNVIGTHEDESGGPARSISAANEDGTVRQAADETGLANHHAARYTGRISGREMTLTVTLTETNHTVGTFKLTQGAQVRLNKCQK